MDEISVPQPVPPPTQPPLSPLRPSTPPMQVCPQCHLSQPLEFYFCPNCGAKLRAPSLSVSTTSQILLYLFSAVLPWIAYLAITKWEGIKYIRSSDPQARMIGYFALGILAVSSLIMFWLTAMWVSQSISSAMNDVGNVNSFGSGL